MDEKLRRLHREAKNGVAPRLELLQTLARAGRPLGDAWSDSSIDVQITSPALPEAELALVAAFDPDRAALYLTRGQLAKLATCPGGELRASYTTQGGFKLWVTSEIHTPHLTLQDWIHANWRWRSDRTFAVALASSTDGELLACALSNGLLRVGPAEQVRAGGASWERPLSGPARTVAVLGDEVLVVDNRLRRFGLRDGEARRELSLGNDPVRLATQLNGWVAVASPSGRLRVYDAGDQLRCDLSGAAYGCRSLALGTRQVAVAGVDVRVYDRESGERVGDVERTYRVTGTWEDPESTMGMGRDVHEIREYSPDLIGAAWRPAGRLVVIDAMGALSEWRVGGAGSVKIQALGSVHPLGDRGPLLAGGPRDRLVLAPSAGSSTLAWSLGPQANVQKLSGGGAPLTALGVAGRIVWLARTDGSLERHDLPGVSLHAPGGG